MDETRHGFQSDPQRPALKEQVGQIRIEFPNGPLNLEKHLGESPRGYDDLSYAARLMKYSQNPLVRMWIWARLEAGRIGDKACIQELPEDERKGEIEESERFRSLERRYYEQMVSGVTPENVIEDNELFRFLQHHVRAADSILFHQKNPESPRTPNQEIAKVIVPDDPRQSFNNLFDREWKADVDLEGTDPIEQPDLPLWLSVNSNEGSG